MQTRREENRVFFLDFREEKFEGKNPISVVLSPNVFLLIIIVVEKGNQKEKKRGKRRTLEQEKVAMAVEAFESICIW